MARFELKIQKRRKKMKKTYSIPIAVVVAIALAVIGTMVVPGIAGESKVAVRVADKIAEESVFS